MANKRPAAASSASEAKAGPAVPQAAPAANSEQEIDELRGPPNTLHTMPKESPMSEWMLTHLMKNNISCPDFVKGCKAESSNTSSKDPLISKVARLKTDSSNTKRDVYNILEQGVCILEPYQADNDNDGDMDVDGNGTGDGNMDEDGDGNMDEDALFLPLDKKPRTK